ncbi:ankyrin repeat domain-containing protein SOWAHC-like [Protopterus annectens]|uniref:ankyrin repeat domain-containing protein SOWAHC-like n=1 Tax=Protopterus annectens TaxID=7888 RepID=UPI001CFAE4A4|nr:ankyrin repeat domain-containing protein SOWAHC-like [Protopterus annectens]
MATEFSLEAVLRFIREKEGKVKNVELLDHFSYYLNDPDKRALARERFKEFVNTVGCVRQENGVKFVCLKKIYKAPNGENVTCGQVNPSANAACRVPEKEGVVVGNGVCFIANESATVCKKTGGGSLAESPSQSATVMEILPSLAPLHSAVPSAKAYGCSTNFASDDAKTTPPNLALASKHAATIRTGLAADRLTTAVNWTASTNGDCGKYPSRLKVNLSISNDMGTNNSSHLKNLGDSRVRSGFVSNAAFTGKPSLTGNSKQQVVSTTEGELAQVESDGCSQISLNVYPPLTGQHCIEQCTNDWVVGNDSSEPTESKSPTHCPRLGVISETHIRKEKDSTVRSEDVTLGQPSNRRRLSRKGLQQVTKGGQHLSVGVDEPDVDACCSLEGESGGSTPKCSRKSFRELMISSSPQLRRSVIYKSPTRVNDCCDSSSLASTDEDSGSVALDPLEHAWMLAASDGRWDCLEGLVRCEPNLITKRDFVTGFTCVHWAAKHGNQELIIKLVNFANKRGIAININSRCTSGYTPLHLSAMHAHVEVVKLLVGAYDADVDVRDYSGKKAWQYLDESIAEEIKALAGACKGYNSQNLGTNGSGRWRISKVLPSNLMAQKLSDLPEEDQGDSATVKSKVVHRKPSSVSNRMKPKLNKMRFRTQIIHTTPSFRGPEDEEGSLSPVKNRPKSLFFG